MNKDDILIIKCNVMGRHIDMDDLHEAFTSMKASGVVIIPAYCDVIIADKKTEIRVEGADDKKEEETCENCKHVDDDLAGNYYPCSQCIKNPNHFSEWELKE